MSDADKSKKGRLGRGLGSLLETHVKTTDVVGETKHREFHPIAAKTEAVKPGQVNPVVHRSSHPAQIAAQAKASLAQAQQEKSKIEKSESQPKPGSSTPNNSSFNPVIPPNLSANLKTPSTGAPELFKKEKPLDFSSISHLQMAPSSGELAKAAQEVKSEGKLETKITADVPEELRIWKMPIEKLAANPKQPRQHFEPNLLKELADSIHEQGILQPIVARRLSEGSFEIVAGERRWRAAQMAGLKEVPVLIKGLDDRRMLELALIENIQRADLNAIEEAKAYEQLSKNFHISHQEIATKVGKDRATISNSLRLLALTPEVQEMLIQNEISAGHAKVLLSLEDSVQQLTLAKRIRSEKLSVRALEREAKRILSGKSEDLKVLSTADELKARLASNIAEELQKSLGTKVAIDYDDSKGKIVIHFYSDEQFNQVVEKLRK